MSIGSTGWQCRYRFERGGDGSSRLRYFKDCRHRMRRNGNAATTAGKTSAKANAIMIDRNRTTRVGT